MPTSKQITTGAQRMTAALARLRDLHPDMTVLQAMCLFTVAGEPNIIQREVHQRLGVSDGLSSRAIAMRGEYGSRNVPAMNLITVHVNPDDRRERNCTLSPKGVRLMHDIISDLKV